MKSTAAKYLSFFKSTRYVVFLLTLALVVVATTVWRSSAGRNSGKVADRQVFLARVRDGIGRERATAKRGDSTERVRVAVNAMALFIEKRSGVQLSDAVRQRLTVLEVRAQNGAGRRLTTKQLGSDLSATALERLAALSDQEIAYVDDTLRGFKAPNMPSQYERSFKLPGGYVWIATPPAKSIGRLSAVRQQLNNPADDLFRGIARNIVRERVRGAAKYLSEAVPEQFGNMWDVANDRETSEDGSITPLQAFLVAYALASDDYLSDGQEYLNRAMLRSQEGFTKVCGEEFPSPDGHRPYGVNGYLFSSPLDLMLDEKTINRLLDRIEGGVA